MKTDASAGKRAMSKRYDARRIGLISDTHGLLREEALDALQGSELILHAGDVGAPEILKALSKIAPVIAVRGNIDTADWARELPETEVAEASGVTFFMLHDLKALDLNPRAARFQVVISGHSHKPIQTERDGIMYINPGSAGPRRFSLPITLVRMDLGRKPWHVEFVDLEKGRRVKS
jgi:uncharacterized protein